MNKFFWILFGFFSVAIGLYPVLYGLVDMSQGFLSSKPASTLDSMAWQWFFYQHIIFGSISLLMGWTQFSKKLRNRSIRIHRLLGTVYVFAVVLSGVAGLYLSFFATGGLISGFGFGAMAILWLSTTVAAFVTIKNGNLIAHQHWMIRSYALCWAAVMLRLWLPSLQLGFGMGFMSAYIVVSWLCWMPNLLVAEVIIRKTR